MGKSVSELLKKRYIQPLFGLPFQRNVDIPQSTPSNMWLVRLDEDDQEVESLRIQTVPLELGVSRDSNWATIPSIGRNNPFYHYTGGEDTLEFTLDWYTTSPTVDDVIKKCRWVQSLTMANGYKYEPPRILLIYGHLFKYTTWIVQSAHYRLSLFDKENNMLPRQAYQDIVLKKVTDHNLAINEFRYIN